MYPSLRCNSRSVITSILQKIGELAATFVSVQHVGISDNVPAYFCAKHASTLEETNSSLDVSRVFLVSSMLDDCNWMLIS